MFYAQSTAKLHTTYNKLLTAQHAASAVLGNGKRITAYFTRIVQGSGFRPIAAYTAPQ